MNGKKLMAIGYPEGRVMGLALSAAAAAAAQGKSEPDILSHLSEMLDSPEDYLGDSIYGEVARYLHDWAKPSAPRLDSDAPYKVWGKAHIEPDALAQLERAVRLPVAVRGALMPDAHVGYGLPIGGVLATRNAVIPYAVGVDIACRMRLTVFDASPHVLEQKREKFRKILEDNTVFGTGEEQTERPDHPVLSDPLWREHPQARGLKDLAWRQLGTSGSGNHFVEFGELRVEQVIETPLGTLLPGVYLSLLSHSGSRRFGFEMANHYTQVAMNKWASLPKDFVHLAWLDLSTGPGAEYWAAMTLAGAYASANHAVIHDRIARALRMEVLGGVENHHNFAWKETLDGEDVIVHRKGATPAGLGVLGVIPGSMSAPGYVVRGRGSAESIHSAAHGAGRRMSRSEAFKHFEWDVVKRKLKQNGVDLISAGLDEVPGVYKDIDQVMAAQADLVETLAAFQPRIVKMDGSKGKSYRPED